MKSDALAAIGQIAAIPTILDVVCRTTGMGFAAVARVTEERWIACGVKDDIAFGLEPGGELKVETTICHEIRQNREAVVINSVADDPVWAAHHTPRMYGLQSYISMPIFMPDGRFFGTLCAIDPKPAMLNTPEVVGMFKMFADLVGFHLDANERVALSDAKLLDERETAKLREQFIAVLGHDLRNPLASVLSGVSLVEKQPQTEKALRILGMMRQSGDRMAGLITNVLDFARGRLGGGLSLERTSVDIEPLVRQVVAECASVDPGRAIIMEFKGLRPVYCDPRRVAQLLSNLVGNATTHGAADAPVRVSCDLEGGVLRLSVANSGVEIPAGARQRLFEPFERGAGGVKREGLGLGLYIASEIAKAHGGSLAAESSPEETRFTFEMPAA